MRGSCDCTALLSTSFTVAERSSRRLVGVQVESTVDTDIVKAPQEAI